MKTPLANRFVPLAAYVLGALIIGGMLALIPGSPAQAHAVVTGTSPAANEVVEEDPEAIHVQFNETVQPIEAAIGVVGPDNEIADVPSDDYSDDDGTAIHIPLEDDLSDGTYLVSYRVVSDDGHPIAGTFTFSLNEASEVPDSDVLSLEGDPTTQAFVYVNRYLGYLGLALAMGAGLLLLACKLPHRALVGKFIASGLTLVAITAVAGLYLQTAYTNGVALTDVTGDALQAFMQSWVGIGLILRLLVILIALPLLRTVVVRDDDPPLSAKLGIAALGLALTVTWPMTGHAIASGHPVTAITADMIHLAAAAAWLGGLIILIFTVLRPKVEANPEVMKSWSLWAGYLIAALFAAGVANSLVEIDSVNSLFNTTYGQLIIAKVVGLGLIVAVAFFSRRVVRRNGGEGRTLLRKLVAVEVALALAVLGVVVVVVQTEPARVASFEAEETVTEVSTIVNTDEFTATVTLEPGHVGNNSVRILVNDSDSGDLLELEEWEASFGPADSDDDLRTIRLVELRGGILGGEITVAGEEELVFEFDITTTEGVQAEGEALMTPHS